LLSSLSFFPLPFVVHPSSLNEHAFSDRSRSPQGKRKDERDRERIPAGQGNDDEDDEQVGGGARNGNMNKSIPLPLSMVLRRLIEDDILGDECWNSEVREAHL